MSELKDGGTRKIYATGAKKEDDSKTVGKGAYHLIPPEPIRQIAEIYRLGAIKYSSWNWSKGLVISRLYDSAMRHLQQFYEGRIDENHLAQSAWNIIGMIHTLDMIEKGKLPPSLNDLPSFGPVNSNEYREEGPGFKLKEQYKGLWPDELELIPDEEKYG